MTEQEFQRELTDLIKRCPDRDDESKSREMRAAAFEVWHDRMQDLLAVCTDEQDERALKLYELHVKNGAPIEDSTL